MPRIFLIFCLLATMPAAAHEFVSKTLRVDHPWVAPADADRGAVPVFLSIENTGDRDEALVSVATTAGLARGAAIVPARARAGFGIDSNADASVDTKAGDRVVVPANGHTQLDADHARIELHQLGIALEPGMRFPMFLRFASGAQLEIEVWVEEPTVHAAHAHDPH